MNYKKAYRIVRNTIFILMTIMFTVIDTFVVLYNDYILFLFFIPAEAVFVLLWWLLLVKYNNSSIVHIETKKGNIKITTLGSDYKITAEKISVKNGKLFSYLYFDDKKLRANNANKSVKSFLYKYQNVYIKLDNDSRS